jgi:hypothetical protein
VQDVQIVHQTVIHAYAQNAAKTDAIVLAARKNHVHRFVMVAKIVHLGASRANVQTAERMDVDAHVAQHNQTKMNAAK